MDKPKWMSDPLVADISNDKLDFLNTIVLECKGKSQKEVMPKLMMGLKQAKEKKISFSGDEINRMMTAIKKYSTQEELDLFEKLKSKHNL